MKTRLTIMQLDHTSVIADAALLSEYWNGINKRQVLEIVVAGLSGQQKQALKAIEKIMHRLYMSTAPDGLKDRLSDPDTLKKHQHNARLRIRRLVDSYLLSAATTGLSIVVDDIEYNAKSKVQKRLKVNATANQNGVDIKSVKFETVAKAAPKNGEAGTNTKAKDTKAKDKAEKNATGKGNVTTSTEDKAQAGLSEYERKLALSQSEEAKQLWLDAMTLAELESHKNMVLATIRRKKAEITKAEKAKAAKQQYATQKDKLDAFDNPNK